MLPKVLPESAKERPCCAAPPPHLPACAARSGADEGGEASDSGDEVEDEGQVGHRLNPKKQRQRVRRLRWAGTWGRGAIGRAGAWEET